MKNNSASIFLKQIISVLCSITKAKSVAIRNKTNALKTRLLVLSLLKNKKFTLGSISQKIQAILGHHDKNEEDHLEDDEQSKAIVLYNASEPSSSSHNHLVDDAADHDQDQYYIYNYNHNYNYEDDDDDKYPDLRHSLFEEEEDDDETGDPNGSVIDLVKNSREGGEDFKLEDEIDQVADLFIMKFHKRMRMQKLASFKRYQEMLQRSV